MKQAESLSAPRGFRFAVAKALRGHPRTLYAIVAATVSGAAAFGMVMAQWLFALPA